MREAANCKGGKKIEVMLLTRKPATDSGQLLRVVEAVFAHTESWSIYLGHSSRTSQLGLPLLAHRLPLGSSGAPLMIAIPADTYKGTRMGRILEWVPC